MIERNRREPLLPPATVLIVAAVDVVAVAVVVVEVVDDDVEAGRRDAVVATCVATGRASALALATAPCTVNIYNYEQKKYY